MEGITDFGAAVRALKSEKRVARVGWNGKGMWLVLLRPAYDLPVTFTVRTYPNDSYDMQPCIGMKTADGKMQPGWLASQADVLAEDWVILD